MKSAELFETWIKKKKKHPNNVNLKILLSEQTSELRCNLIPSSSC